MLYYDVKDYTVSPSVVKAGEQTTIVIKPNGSIGAFEEGKTYDIKIMGVEDFATDLHDRPEHKLQVTVQNGCVSFDWFFGTEQTYVIKFDEKQIKRKPKAYGNKVRVFAAEADLYERLVLKADFHCHTTGSDGHDAPEQTVGNMRSCGIDVFAVTDHRDMQPSIDMQRDFSEFSDVINIINAEEVHVPDDYVHMISLGGKSVVQEYCNNTERCNEEIQNIFDSLELPEGISKRDFAYRVWAADKSRELGGLPLLTHPFWLWADVFFQNPKTVEELIKQGVYNCFEILNGVSDYHTNLSQIAFFHEMRAKGYNISIVGSSDSHTTSFDDFRDNIYCYTYVFSKGRDFESVKKAILDGWSVAVMKYPEDTHPTITGSFRLVKYAEFLYYCYFENYMQLTNIQGKLFHRIHTDPEAKDMILTQQKIIDRFKQSFFGR
ncbi:MAG: PHP domain-containing protein [Clostridia bacterium]|nr:PHP domain-containing protein [Clostridia bacterium]